MTREQTNRNWPAFCAWKDGKHIQCSWKGLGAWTRYNGNNPDFSDPEMEWRPDPERKLREWKREDVKPCIVRHSNSYNWSILQGVTDYGCIVLDLIDCKELSFKTMLAHWLYSLDHGQTWNPCGVMEGG